MRSGLEYDFLIVCQMLVNYSVHEIQVSERRFGSEFAIVEYFAHFIFTGQAQLFSAQNLGDFTHIQTITCRKNAHYIFTAIVNDHGFSDNISAYMFVGRNVLCRIRRGMFISNIVNPFTHKVFKNVHNALLHARE